MSEANDKLIKLGKAWLEKGIKSSDDMVKLANSGANKGGTILGGFKHKIGETMANAAGKTTGYAARKTAKVATYAGGAVGLNYLAGNPVGAFNEAVDDMRETFRNGTPVMDFIADNLGSIATTFVSLVGWGITSRIPLVGSYLSTPLMLTAGVASLYTAWNAWGAYNQFNEAASDQPTTPNQTVGQKLNEPLNLKSNPVLPPTPTATSTRYRGHVNVLVLGYSISTRKMARKRCL